MSYLDTVLTPLAGQSYVLNSQIYDTIAGQLTAHPNWEFVETVDYVSGTTTYRTRIWRCLTAGSGLSKPFHVFFTETLSNGLSYTSGSTAYLMVGVFEDWDAVGKIASKPVAQQYSAPFAPVLADGAHPGTWGVSSATSPTASDNTWVTGYVGNAGNYTSTRLILLVRPDHFVYATNSAVRYYYVGAYDPVPGLPNDFPLCVTTSNYSYSRHVNSMGGVGFSRHPMVTGAQSRSFGGSPARTFAASTSMNFFDGAEDVNYNNNGVTLGSSTSDWDLFAGGATVCRICISHTTNTSGYFKQIGGRRGYLKGGGIANAVSHQFGDTFQIDGKPWVSISGSTIGGFWDTTL